MRTYSKLVLLACLSFIGMAEISLEAKEAKKATAKASNKSGDALTPALILDDMKASVFFIVKNATGISQKSKQARPFWSSLQQICDGIDEMEIGLEDKNASMLDGLEMTGRGVTQLAASWGMIRGAHPKSQIGRGVTSLASAYEMFNEHYGPAVARYKKGGKITQAELAIIEKSGAQLERFLANLEKVAAKAKENSYQERMILDLVRLLEDLAAVEGTGKKAYASYIYQWNRLEYALAAYSDIISVCYPEYYTVWSVLDTDLVAMSSVFEEELWSYYETWDISVEVIEEYDDYYEETAIVETIEESEEAQYEQVVEHYEEEEAIEESEEEEEQLEEEIEIEEDEDASLFEEVEDSYGDDDGDGVADEEDADDDNDCVIDEEDTDDDGDGLCDEEDADTEEEEEEEMEEESDDDGIAESCEGCCCGSCCE